ncbi:MAG: CAP domain-containing protein [Planctomycetes bacterium]|nr:CAP domain-containing protein [Planctomycetota bacterium]
MAAYRFLVNLTYVGLLGALLLGGCPAADSTAAKTPVLGITARATGVQTATVPSNNDILVAQVLKLVNDRRTWIGLNELTLNPVLSKMAEAYASDMIERDFFAHQNPNDPEDPGDRAIKAGYVFIEIGENLAAGQETAEQVVSEWMASPEHRDIILGPQWREMGVGIRIGGEYNVYWVLEFGNPP